MFKMEKRMNFDHLDQIRFHVSQTVREVMEKFNETAIYTQGKGFGVVEDENNCCVGIVTDGDIRNHLIKGGLIDAQITEVMNREFVYSYPEDSPHKILRLFDHRVRTIPVIDHHRLLVGLLQYSDFTVSARLEDKVIRSRVPVRVSFAGGGTDMSFYICRNNGFVLNSTINKYCYATIRVRPDSKIRIISKDYQKECEADGFQNFIYGDSLDLIKACIRIMEPEFGFDIETYSEIEPGTGLGGSSAIAAAVIGALNHFRNQNHLNKYHIADLAYQAERIDLGIAGGWQDQYATVFGGLNLLEFRPNEVIVYPIRVEEDVMLELHYNLLLFRFGKNRDSGCVANDQEKTFNQSASVMEVKYDKMTQLTLKMKDMLLRGSLREFGELLHEGWEIKKALSTEISNGFIENLYSAARNAGAIGGKVLGAGKCGYLLLFCPPAQQLAVAETLQALGAIKENFDFVDTGLQTWTAHY